MAYVEEAKESPANQYKDTENKENIPDLYSLHRGYFPGLPLSSSLSQLGAPVSPLSPPPLPSQVGTPLSHFSRKEIELLRRLSPFQGPSTYCFGFIQPKPFFLLLTLLVPFSALVVVLISSFVMYKGMYGGTFYSGKSPSDWDEEVISHHGQPKGTGLVEEAMYSHPDNGPNYEPHDRQEDYAMHPSSLPKECHYHEYMKWVHMCPIRRVYRKRFMCAVALYQEKNGTGTNLREKTKNFTGTTNDAGINRTTEHFADNVFEAAKTDRLPSKTHVSHRRQLEEEKKEKNTFASPPPSHWPSFQELSQIPQNPFFILKAVTSQPFHFPDMATLDSLYEPDWLPFDMKDAFLSNTRSPSRTTGSTSNQEHHHASFLYGEYRGDLYDYSGSDYSRSTSNVVDDRTQPTTQVYNNEDDDGEGDPRIMSEQPTWFDVLPDADLAYRQFRYAFSILIHGGHSSSGKRNNVQAASTTTTKRKTSGAKKKSTLSPLPSSQLPPSRYPKTSPSGQHQNFPVIWIALFDGFMMMASPHLVIGYGPLNGLSSLIEYFPDASIRHLMETYRSSYIVEKDSSSMGKKSSIFSTRGSTEEGPAVPLQSGDGIQLIPGHILRPQRWENLEDQWDRKLRIQTIE